MKKLQQSCTVGVDYLGLPLDKVSTSWISGYQKGTKYCSYYRQVEDDTDHPSERVRCCGNCTHYIIVEVKDALES